MSRNVRTPPAGLAPAGGLAAAILPLRAFLGGTFLYAGFDKLLDPRFFDPTSPASIQSQMIAFTRSSPVAFLVRVGQPAAVPIGLLIAVAEIAIGLGALTGLAFRPAALGGFILSILFFLTASWATRPFYYGPDLPFAAGWLTLLRTGHGGRFVLERLVTWASGAPPAGPIRGRPRAPAPEPTGWLALTDRRSVLQAGVLGAIAALAASIAIPLRGEAPAADSSADDGVGAAGPSAAVASSSPGGSPAASSVAAGGILVGHVADLARTGARAFRVPFTAPAPLPAGDPGVLVKLADGSVVAFDAVCTHAGCTVQWDRQDRVLLCPCHGAAFDPERSAAVLQGPTNEPLAGLPIHVDPASGAITLRA